MNINLTLWAANTEKEVTWANELRKVLGDTAGIVVECFSQIKHCGQVLFIDEALPDLEHLIDGLDRKGKALFLITRNENTVPAVLTDGRVDDVIIAPFRYLEIRSKLNHYRQLLMWDEVKQLNASFQELIQGLREDLNLAERLQKSKLPLRFPEIKGFKVNSRYLAGMRSGGDHFDLADSKDGSRLSVILSDSSSYGLASAVLSVLMKVAVKLSSEEIRSSYETVQRIHEEISLTLSEKDKLSLFYGVFSRKDFRLKYLNLGTSVAFYSPKGEHFRELPAQGGSIAKTTPFPSALTEGEIVLQPQDRLALISDGFVEAVGGSGPLCELLDRFRDREAVDAMNEMVYFVKSKFAEPDDMPDQDCTSVIFDVDSRILRLA